MLETWSIWEIVWSLIAIVGGGYSISNIYNGVKDLFAIFPLKLVSPFPINNDPDVIIASGNIRRDTFRLIIQGIFLVIGIWAGLLPNRPDNNDIGALIFISASLLLTLSAVFDRRDRDRILKLKLEELKKGKIDIPIS